MNIGIIVHSQTGNTYSVIQKLQEKLLESGHTVDIERITPVGGEQADASRIKLETQPDINIYDALVFGAPVHGASVSPVMAACFSRIGSLQGKKVACLVTEFFPFAWMGGNRAINQMKKACESKGAIVCGTGIVNWSSSRRGEMITEVVDKLSSLF